MLKNSLQPDARFRDNPLEFHLQTLATSLGEDGYVDETVRLKLRLLADLGRWLGRTGLALAYLNSVSEIEEHCSVLIR